MNMIAIERATDKPRRPANWPTGWPLPLGRAGLTPEEEAEHEREYCEYLDRLERAAAEADAKGENDRW